MTVVIPAREDVIVVKALVNGDVRMIAPVHAKEHADVLARLDVTGNVLHLTTDKVWQK